MGTAGIAKASESAVVSRPVVSAACRSAAVSAEFKDDGLFLALSGDCTVRTVAGLERDIALLRATRRKGAWPPKGRLDCAGLGTLDTAGAWLVGRVIVELANLGCRLEVVGARPNHSVLIGEVRRLGNSEVEVEKCPGRFSRLVSAVGAGMGTAASEISGLVGFLGVFLTGFVRSLATGRFRLTAFVHHLEHTGLRAIPITGLICFLIGAVVMQQGALQLAAYGAEPYAANMLGVLALREIGVLLTAVMVAGRSASAFTAEIGSMKMREEIAAMRTMGIDPVETLVVPRIAALLVALPLLTFVGDIMCLAGGAVVAVFHLDQSLSIFLERLQAAAELRHFLAGMIKTPFAALVIGLVGCAEGLKVAGSAESLGRHVTSAVVKAIFLVIILGALFAMFLVSVGI